MLFRMRTAHAGWTRLAVLTASGLAAALALAACQQLVPGATGMKQAAQAAGAVLTGNAATGQPGVSSGGSSGSSGGSSGSSGQTVTAAARATIVAQADWILSSQMADGAIASGPVPSWSPTVHVFPYLANYGAIGLARATAVTGDPSYAAGAWRWLQWYGAHEQPGTGYVEDTQIANTPQETATPLGTEDSTDAYAGTFLLAAYDTEVADPNPGALHALGPAIAGAVAAIRSTQQPDGLTWAQPTYKAAYLMDESESYAGLQAARALQTELGNTAAASVAASAAASMAAGVASLWRPADDGFAWAAFPSGATTAVNWSYLYPDAMEQAWPVAFGLTTAQQSATVLGALTAHAPQWDEPNASKSMRGTSGQTPVGFWPLVSWAFEQAGQTAAAQQAAASIWQAAQPHLGWPFTVADAGELIVAESGGPTLAAAASSTP